MAQAQGESNTIADKADRAARGEGQGQKPGDDALRASRSFTESAARRTGEQLEETVRSGASMAEEVVQAGAQTAETTLRGLTEAMTQAFGLGDRRSAELAQKSAENLHTVSEAARVLTRGAQDVSRECLNLAEARLKANVNALGRLAGCRSAPDMLALQGELWRESVQRTVEATQVIARTSLRAIDEASQAIRSSP